jgi:DNA uptake protein ComE-like DNA-binding protein
VLRFRGKHTFTSIDELDDVPGFCKVFLDEIKGRLVP